MMIIFFILGVLGVLIHIALIKYAGFENVYETLKNVAEIAKATDAGAF